MESPNDRSCEVRRGKDGSYSVIASPRDLAMIRKFQQLSPSWKRMIARMLDSILSPDPADPKVIPFPYGRRRTDRTAQEPRQGGDSSSA